MKTLAAGIVLSLAVAGATNVVQAGSCSVADPAQDVITVGQSVFDPQRESNRSIDLVDLSLGVNGSELVVALQVVDLDAPALTDTWDYVVEWDLTPDGLPGLGVEALRHDQTWTFTYGRPGSNNDPASPIVGDVDLETNTLSMRVPLHTALEDSPDGLLTNVEAFAGRFSMINGARPPSGFGRRGGVLFRDMLYRGSGPPAPGVEFSLASGNC